MERLLIIIGAKHLFFVVVIVAFWHFLKQNANIKKQILFLAILSFPLAYVAARIASSLYYSPLPFASGDFTPLINHVPDNGFPSDYVLMGSVISSIMFVYVRKMGGILFILTFLIGVARVFSGVHSFIDIFAGMFIACTSVWLMHIYLFSDADSKEG